MAMRLVYIWRGVIRGRLKIAKAALNSILAYNVKHVSANLLTAAQVQTLTNAAALIGNRNDTTTLLGAVKPR